jgi:putrescine transport system substrate-binding protein
MIRVNSTGKYTQRLEFVVPWRARSSRILATGACVLAIGLIACSRQGAAPATAAGDDKVLNIYQWSDYIAPDTVANFEKETGIKVRFDTYASNEILETKLLTGKTNYDIVMPSGQFFERQRLAGVYQKLDKTALPNRVNLDPELMRRIGVHDPGNLYGVPYMWSTTGIGFNAAEVSKRLGGAPPDSWSLLFDPANAAKLKDCGIEMIDSPTDVFQSAMLFLGRDPNRMDPADVTAASEVLLKIRPFIRNIDTEQYWSDLANGTICAVLGWSGDIERGRSSAKAAGNGVNITYFVPREGGLLLVDMLGIPADAPHPKNAELWLNYLMRPEVIANITNFINYPNGNLKSLDYVRADIKTDIAVYPDASTRARLVTTKMLPLDYSRLITREWTRFRTGD